MSRRDIDEIPLCASTIGNFSAGDLVRYVDVNGHEHKAMVVTAKFNSGTPAYIVEVVDWNHKCLAYENELTPDE